MSRPISGESAFRAVADPTRRRIIDLLEARPHNPAELNQTLKLNPTVLTFHLQSLAKAGVVAQQREGRHRVYRLMPRVLQPISAWIQKHSKSMG